MWYPFKYKGGKMACAKMKISQQLAWDFAGYCGERISTKWCQVTSCLHPEQHFKVSCLQLPSCWSGNFNSCWRGNFLKRLPLLVEEVTDVHRWSTPPAFVKLNTPSKRCAFFVISVIRIHIWGNSSLLYPWDLTSWSLNCWGRCVCL